ncbi:MAG TPA: DUF302 domain-containing protein [Thermoleophilia bacterium]|nr:MAG: hypothetical protein BWY94_01789 [Actinobacteria bacterium ADurb.BinA094]HQF52617.1 DUF302 domain-containing protein [Thermoleophilia bacterium]HQH21968.1 DUF302 domain-containing protein [Thermoleophilia bacterium]HQJ26003.1 DUF302 domain-containing protein [Thermoleophilia bacterium]
MESIEYGVGRYLDQPYETALPHVVEALKTEGFGVVTEIDVRETMREKLGVDVTPHTILGACNPELAHAALQVEPDLGVLLPCNVVVYATPRGTRVTAVNAGAMLGMVGNPALERIAAEVGRRLDRVLESL